MIPRGPLTKRQSLLGPTVLVGLMAAALSRSFAAEPEVIPISSSDQLYALENLLKVEITVAPNDWDALRFSWRGELLEEKDGKWVTTTSDYDYVPGEVTINGVKVGKVGLRKKGFFGSLSAQRPSLKLKFDEYVKGQEFVGQEELTLNNNLQDDSQLRQYLAYSWFRRAGLPASRCNFARVFVNGKYLGLYSNVEPVDKAFLKRNFDSAKGTLFEGTSVDFQPRAVEAFEAKTDRKSPDRSRLRELAQLLRNFQSADIEKVSEVVDVDQFMRFWISEMLLGHWDGYAGNANNFFVYDNPASERLDFLPWGADQTFNDSAPFLSGKAPKIIRGKGRLCAALYSDPTYRQRYLNLVAKQLDEWWNSTEMLAEVERTAARIRPHVHLRQTDFDKGLTGLREYIERTPRVVRDELKAAPDQWLINVPQEGPARPASSEPQAPRWAGSVKSDFQVPFGSYDLTKPHFLTNGTFAFEWRDKPVEFPIVTGTAGYKAADPLWFESPEMVISRTSPTTGQTVWIYLSIDPDLLMSGQELKLHKSEVVSWFGTAQTGAADVIIHGTLQGTLKAKLVETDGVKYIKGTIDAHLSSGRPELEF